MLYEYFNYACAFIMAIGIITAIIGLAIDGIKYIKKLHIFK